MKHLWPADALAFQESVAGALGRLGGTDFTRRCEDDPELRTTELLPVLAKLNFDELDPSAGATEAAAAALGVRAAGAVVCPWPLVARLAAPLETRDEFEAFYLVDRPPTRLEHLDLSQRAVAQDVATGAAREVFAVAELERMPLDPFGVPCRCRGAVETGLERAVAASVVLTAFWVLGALDRVLDQVAGYARERHQFGRPIASFGAIQWRLSDLALARDGLYEMAAFTLLRFSERRESLADLFALRLTTLESAHSGLADGHQILGAIGLCEEHDVTLIDRHLQACLRRPTGVATTTALLAKSIAELGFDAIYPIEPAATEAQAVGDRVASVAAEA